MAASPFRPANLLLTQYAAYHRDTRNIASHFIGIPLIVLGLAVLLAQGRVGGISLAWAAWALTSAWYLTRGEWLIGAATCGLNGLLIAAAHPLASGAWGSGPAWGVGLFVLGWLIQFVGHHWEGRKPAFVDDLIGLLVGPMFVVAEWVFAAGGRPALAQEIEKAAGPTRRRSAGNAAA